MAVKVGFISPTGEFYEMEINQKHYEKAIEIIKDRYLAEFNNSKYSNSIEGSTDFLVLEKGWIKVGNRGNNWITVKNKYDLTNGQYQTIENLGLMSLLTTRRCTEIEPNIYSNGREWNS